MHITRVITPLRPLLLLLPTWAAVGVLVLLLLLLEWKAGCALSLVVRVGLGASLGAAAMLLLLLLAPPPAGLAVGA
jgi:hypothetical protein